MKAKKLLSLFLALVMTLSLCSVTAFADGESYKDDESFVGSNKLRVAGKLNLFGLDLQVAPNYDATLTVYKGYEGYSSEEEAGIRIAVNGMEHIGSVDKWIDVGNVGIEAIHEKLEGTQVNLNTVTYDWLYGLVQGNLFWNLNGQTITFTYGEKTSSFALVRTDANDDYTTLTITADDVDFGEDWEALMNDGAISVTYDANAAEAVSATLAEGSYVRLGNQKRTLTSNVALNALDSTGEIDLANITSVLMGDIEETKTLAANDGKVVLQLNAGTTVTLGKTTATLGSNIRITVDGLNVADDLIDTLTHITEGLGDLELSDYTGLLDIIPNGGTVAINAEVNPEPEVEPEPEPEPVDPFEGYETYIVRSGSPLADSGNTFAENVKSVQAGDTLVVNNDIVLATSASSWAKVAFTIDLNGHTIASSGTKGVTIINPSSSSATSKTEVTIINSSSTPASINAAATGSTACAIKAHAYSTVTIGNNTAPDNGLGGGINVSASSSGKGALFINGTNATQTGALTIYGGNFDGAISTGSNISGMSVEFYGGTFNTNPTAYVAEGYEAVDNGDGTWTVLPLAVATIGNVRYETLADAIAAAQDGDTITLLADVNVNAAVFISKSITLDGDNHTLATTASRAIRINQSDVAVTIKDLNIVGGSGTERSVQVDSDKDDVTLTLDNVTATATMYTVNICGNVDNLVLTVNDCHLTGWGVINLWGNNGTVNVSNSTLVGINDKTYNADGWNDFGVIILEGDTTGQTDEHSTAYDVTVTNCNITATSTTGNTQYVLLHNNPSAYNSLALDACTITLGTNCEFFLDQAVESVTKIKDTFIADTTALPTLPEGYVYAPIADNYQLITQAVAEVNGVGYPTLAAAIAAAEDGDTVKLLSDIDYSEIYTERNARDYDRGHAVDLRDLTLDLDGHTIKSINATVTFGGNGATIKNGTFDLVEKNTDGSYKDGSYALIIDNAPLSYDETGAVAVKDVTIDGGLNVCCATVTLDNVTAHTTTTKYYAVWAETNATLTINSGTFTDEQTQGKGVIATGKNDEGGAVVYVKGGTFTGVNKLVYSAEAGSLKISGGTFDHDPTAYVAEGYESVEVTSGTWQVGEVKATAIAPAAEVTNGYEATYTASKKVVDGDNVLKQEEATITVNVKAVTAADTGIVAEKTTAASDIAIDKVDMQAVLDKAVANVEESTATVNVEIKVVHDNPALVNNTITYEVHPEVTAYVDDVPVSTVAIGNDDLAENASFTITLPVPDALMEGNTTGQVKVTHRSVGHDAEVSAYTVQGEPSNYYVTLTVTHFSEFELEAVDAFVGPGTAHWGATLSLEDEVVINLKVWGLQNGYGEAETDFSRFTASYTYHGVTKTVPMYKVGTDKDHANTFVVARCAAKELTDEVTLKLFYDGVQIGDTKTYSARTYCTNKIADPSGDANPEALRELCHALLAYGAAAQVRFNYKTDDLANVNDSYSYPAYIGVVSNDFALSVPYEGRYETLADAYNNLGASLSLEEKTKIFVYFQPRFGDSYEVYANGVKVTNFSDATIGADQFIRVEIPGLAAKNLGTQVEIEIHDITSSNSYTFHYSPMNWAYNKTQHYNSSTADDFEIACALYNYYLKADAYFNG